MWNSFILMGYTISFCVHPDCINYTVLKELTTFNICLHLCSPEIQLYILANISSYTKLQGKFLDLVISLLSSFIVNI